MIGTTAAILGAAAIGGAASLASGAMQAKAAEKAANAQENAANQSVALQKEMFDTTRQDSMPWLDAGKTALTSYMGELGLSDEARAGTFKSAFETTPGYEFQVSEGQKGVVNSLGALGMKNSGAALKALTRFREGLASTEYNNYLTRLAGVAGGGQTQANTNTQAALTTGTNIGNTLESAGEARASSYTGQAKGWSNALTGLTNTSGWALGRLSGATKDWGSLTPNYLT